MRPLAAAGIALLIVGGALLASLPQNNALGFIKQESFREVPVVVVVFDEFPIATLMNRQGKIDAGLFPNFARLQKDSTWFRNATTPATFTSKAIPALLSGTYPKNQTRTSIKRTSLFNLLGGSYEIRSSEPELRRFCPDDECKDQPTGAMDNLVERYGHIFPGDRGQEFLRLLSFIKDGDKPKLYFMHLVMPHQPWRYLPSGQAYPQTSPIPGEVESAGKGKEWVKNKWLVNQAYQRHLLQTALLDRQLGVLLDRLKKKDMYGRSLIVAAADHGIAYAPGASKRVMTKETVGHIAGVPLFVKVPHQGSGRISDLPVETVDIVPSLADVLNLSHPPKDIDGISMFSSDFPQDRKRTTQRIRIGSEGRAKFRVAKMKYEMFGRTDGDLDLWDTGPGDARQLVGELVSEMNVEPLGTTTASVPDAESHENTEPDAPLLPALLEGELYGPRATAGERLAIAMNGRIVATTRAYEEDELVHFYAMLPPHWFGAPPNELEIYLIEDVGARTLEPLQLSDSLGTLALN
jgi:Sulfatase